MVNLSWIRLTCVLRQWSGGLSEIPVLHAILRERWAGRRTRKGTSFMNGSGKSDCRVVPEKVSNKGENPRRVDQKRKQMAILSGDKQRHRRGRNEQVCDTGSSPAICPDGSFWGRSRC